MTLLEAFLLGLRKYKLMIYLTYSLEFSSFNGFSLHHFTFVLFRNIFFSNQILRKGDSQ